VTFSEKTLAEFDKKLPHDVVKTRTQAGQRLSFVEGWWVLERANAVFGHDGWSCEVLSQTVLFSGPDGDKYSHVVRSHVRVRAGDVVRDGVGVGVGRAKGPAEAIELAEKAAETDAQKRALRTFGASFGLALYDKDQEGVGPSREALRLCDEVSRVSDVDAWARAHRADVAQLGPADQDEVKAAAKARREALAATAAPAQLPAPSSAPAQLPAPAAGSLLSKIASAKGMSALALLADDLCAAPLNGSAGAVFGAYAARWAKGLDNLRDATSLAAAVTAYRTLDARLREERLDAIVQPAIARAGERIQVAREPGEEG